MYEQQFYEVSKDLDGKEAFFVDKKAKNEIYYRMAKGAFRAGHYKTAEKWALRVEGSTFGPSAQYVTAISQYEAKDKSEARETMETLSHTADSSEKTLKGLVAVNLARMDFNRVNMTRL